MEIEYKNNPSKLLIADRLSRLQEIIKVSKAFLERAIATKEKDEADISAMDK